MKTPAAVAPARVNSARPVAAHGAVYPPDISAELTDPRGGPAAPHQLVLTGGSSGSYRTLAEARRALGDASAGPHGAIAVVHTYDGYAAAPIKEWTGLDAKGNHYAAVTLDQPAHAYRLNVGQSTLIAGIVDGATYVRRAGTIDDATPPETMKSAPRTATSAGAAHASATPVVAPRADDPPGMSLYLKYGMSLLDLPGAVSASWRETAPDDLTLTYQSPELAQLARGVVRDTIAGAHVVFESQDGKPLPAPPAPGAAQPWYDNASTQSKAAAALPGIVTNWSEQPDTFVLFTTTQDVADYYTPLLKDHFGAYPVEVIDDPTIEGAGIGAPGLSQQAAKLSHRIKGGWQLTNPKR